MRKYKPKLGRQRTLNVLYSLAYIHAVMNLCQKFKRNLPILIKDYVFFKVNSLLQSIVEGKSSTILLDFPVTLLKKRLWNRYFPVNFAKFLRTPY